MSAEAEGGGHDERWVISYADLVTLLLGFFIILYSTAEVDLARFQQVRVAFAEAFNVDVRQGTEGSSPLFDGGTGIVPGGNLTNFVDPDLDFIRTTLEAELEEAGLGLSTVVVTRDADDVVIRLADHLLFPSASAALQPAARQLLDVVAGVLATVPNDVRVEGHTDNVPVATERYPTNWELSSARATTVVRTLVEAGGIPAARLTAAGYAEFRPVASNSTPEGRAQNRRADIVIIAPPEAAPDGPALAPDITPAAPSEGGAISDE